MLLKIKRLTAHQSLIKHSSKQKMMRTEKKYKKQNDEAMRN